MEGALAKSSFLETAKTVLWGAVGIRRRVDHDRTPLNPFHLAILGVLFAVLFIFTLLTIVRAVTA